MGPYKNRRALPKKKIMNGMFYSAANVHPPRWISQTLVDQGGPSAGLSALLAPSDGNLFGNEPDDLHKVIEKADAVVPILGNSDRLTFSNVGHQKLKKFGAWTMSVFARRQIAAFASADVAQEV